MVFALSRPGPFPGHSPANSPLFTDIRADGAREAYNALVMERLGDNLEKVFRRYRSADDSSSYEIVTRGPGPKRSKSSSQLSTSDSASPPFDSQPLYDGQMAHLIPPPYRSIGLVGLGEIAKPIKLPLPAPSLSGDNPKDRQPSPSGSLVIAPQFEKIAMRVRPKPIGRHMHQPEPQLSPTPPATKDNRSSGWDSRTIVWIGCQILRRLEYVHGKGIVHRDVVSRKMAPFRRPVTETIEWVLGQSEGRFLMWRRWRCALCIN
jgi:hypothetical protein